MVKKTNSNDVESGKVCAILAYFLVGIIWFLVDEKMKKNNFAKFHVKQSLVLLIFSVIINVVGTIIPIIGWFIILPLGSLLTLVLFIFGIVYSAKGEQKELPLIGQFGEHFKF